MRFGEIVEEARRKKRITLRQFSKEMGYSSSFISKIERGVIDPPASDVFLKKLQSILKFDTVELLTLYSAYLENNIVEQKKIYPAFPSINGDKPTREQYEKLTDIINS